jgi:energy-coupling factor transporter ATP-binding protein EcfA2
MRPSRISLSTASENFLDLERLNLIIGSNGAGKTRLFHQIQKLFDRSLISDDTFNIREGANSEIIQETISQSQLRGVVGASPRRETYRGVKNSLPSAFFELNPIHHLDYKSNNKGEVTEISLVNSAKELFLNSLERADIEISADLLFGSIDWCKSVADLLTSRSQVNEVMLKKEPGERLPSALNENWGYLKPLRSLLLSIPNGIESAPSIIFDLITKESVLQVFSREGEGILYARLAREDFSNFELSVAIEENTLEGLTGPLSSFIGIRQLFEDVDIFDNVDAEILQNRSDYIFDGFLQWDDDLLIPIISLDSFRLVKPSMVSTLIEDSTKPIKIDIEQMVLEFAASIGRDITDYSHTPMVDWIYKFGESYAAGTRGIPKVVSGDNRIYRIHPAVLSACKFISDAVNATLPSFIAKDYIFHLEAIGPEDWIGRDRIKYGLLSKTSENHVSDNDLSSVLDAMVQHRPVPLLHLDSVGAGIRRWVQISLSIVRDAVGLINLDYSALNSSFELSLGEEKEELLGEWDTPEYDWQCWIYFCESENGHDLLSFEGFQDSRILLIDEPEANLHPEAIDSVCDWLVNQAVSYGSIMVATHSMKIFDIAFLSTNRFNLSAKKRESLHSGLAVFPESRITKIDVDPSYLDSWSNEMGFTPGEMFLTTKRWLVVEGEVDKIVIETLFGKLLKTRGVKVIPVRGSGNVNTIFQVDFLRGLGAKVSVLLDRDAPDAHKSDSESLRTKIEKGYFKKDLSRSDSIIDHRGNPGGVLLGVVNHSEYDVMFFLDPDSVIEVLAKSVEKEGTIYSKFEDWKSCWTDFENMVKEKKTLRVDLQIWKLTVKDFKDFLRIKHGISVTPWFAREVARRQLLNEKIPTELFHVIDQITSPFFGSPLNFR